MILIEHQGQIYFLQSQIQMVGWLLIGLLIWSVETQCNNSSRIRVTGEGVAQGIPDTALIHIQISNASISATNASASVKSSLQQVLYIINSYRIPINQVEIININLAPVMNSSGNITGYNSSQIIAVQILGISDPEGVPLGTFVDQISLIAGVRMSGAHFEVSNKTVLLNTARANSFKDARSNAQIFSSLGGFRLQSITNILQVQETHPSNSTIKFNTNDLLGFQRPTPNTYTVKIVTTVEYTLSF